MSPRLLTTALCLSALSTLSAAQLREPGVPASRRAVLPAEVPCLVLDVPGPEARRALAAEEPVGPLRYGTELPVHAGLEDAGRWDTVPGTGELVWRLEIASPGAYSLGVFFERFDLPPGAQVFVHAPNGGEVLGAYGESTENPNGMLFVQPLRGDRAVIEYVEPPDATTRPELVVGTVTHDWLDLLSHMAPGGTLALACLIDVNCPQGAARQDIKRGVIWMLRSGVGCSGSILNNTAEDKTPYMMTAEHCGNFTNGVFVFEYERTGCGAGASSTSKTLSGSTQLAVSSFYDGQLYRLNQSIPASYHPFFAGWSRSTAVHAQVVGISHPSGDPKKISIDNQDPFLTANRWSVQFDAGAIEPGSSGSPLFDQAKRVIGSASTGSGGCSTFANYGRFDLFWETSGLGTWLDPQGWDLSGIDGLEGNAPYARTYVGSGANPNVYTSVTEPRLGTNWVAQIDTSFQPAATSTVLAGYAVPAEGPTMFYGELLVDLGSPQQFQHSAPVSAGLSTHTFALPSLMALVGRVSYTQAFVLGGGARATNGVKLVLNF